MQASPTIASALLNELPLTEIPDIKKKTPLSFTQEQRDFFSNFFNMLQDTVFHWDAHFKDLSRVIVTNLHHCLAIEEEARERDYRDKAGSAVFSGPLVNVSEEDLISRRIKVLWILQDAADTEAGRATMIPIVEPRHLLEVEKLVFIRERHLLYLTESEPPEKRAGCTRELQKLTNSELRQRYIDICRKRLEGYASRHQYLPGTPAAYSAQDITWPQLAFEWLEIRFDDLFKQDEQHESQEGTKASEDRLWIGLFYRWTQAAFLAAACDLCFYLMLKILPAKCVLT